MKIDKVIIAVDDNPTYVSFWNVVSPIWSEIFKIQPVLIFNGTTDEFNNLGFNVKENEFFIVNKIPNVSESRPDWAVTWSLFWGASKFENDVCMLTGIDQIPLGTFFFEQIEKFSNDDFVVGFSDAYRTYTKNSLGYFNTNTNVMYPSSHLVGKGKMFKEIFEIHKDVYIYNSLDFIDTILSIFIAVYISGVSTVKEKLVNILDNIIPNNQAGQVVNNFIKKVLNLDNGAQCAK
jgi:hypothetical protein